MEETVTCDVCRSGIGYPVCFQLNPCLHKACVKCFHEFVPAGVFDRCPCSGCREIVASSTLLELTETVRRSKTHTRAGTDPIVRSSSDDSDNIASLKENRSDAPAKTDTARIPPPPVSTGNGLLRAVQEVPHFRPDEQMDPFRHWAIEKPSLYTGFLYVAYRSKEDEATFYKSSFKAFDSSVFMDDNSTDELVKIFARILHPLLFPTRRGSFSDESDGERKRNVFFGSTGEHYRRQDRQHLAMRCLYAMSSGRVLTRAEQEEQFFGGTRKNPKQTEGETPQNQDSEPFLATRKLAKELLGAYKVSCAARTPPTPSSPRSLPVVHDLTRDDDGGSDCSPPIAPSTVFYEEPHRHRIPPDHDTDEKEPTEVPESKGGRSWANELGLNEILSKTEEECDNAPSPIVPAILWILSAVFILSK